jgi:hypothetical protein
MDTSRSTVRAAAPVVARIIMVVKVRIKILVFFIFFSSRGSALTPHWGMAGIPRFVISIF